MMHSLVLYIVYVSYIVYTKSLHSLVLYIVYDTIDNMIDNLIE